MGSIAKSLKRFGWISVLTKQGFELTSKKFLFDHGNRCSLPMHSRECLQSNGYHCSSSPIWYIGITSHTVRLRCDEMYSTTGSIIVIYRHPKLMFWQSIKFRLLQIYKLKKKIDIGCRSVHRLASWLLRKLLFCHSRMVVALEALGAVTACIAHQSFTARVLLELESIEKKSSSAWDY